MQRDAVESGASNQRPVAPREADPSPPCSSPEGTALRQYVQHLPTCATWHKGERWEPNYKWAMGRVWGAWVPDASSDPACTCGLDAVLARLPHQLEHSWQPIETAPKDGTEILLSNGSYKRTGWWARRINAWSIDSAVPLDQPDRWAPLPHQPEPEQ